jgi:hypothetical protein
MRIKNIFKNYDLNLFIILLIIGIVSRTIFHLGANIELITALSISGGYYFRNKKLTSILILSVLFLTDLIIGNSIIYLFTWSGFLVGSLIGIYFHKINIEVIRNKFFNLLLKSEIAAIASTLLFFLWTNLGVVLTTNMYSHDLLGLRASYIMALPFLRNQIIGNMIFVPLFILVIKMVLDSNYFKKIVTEFSERS